MGGPPGDLDALAVHGPEHVLASPFPVTEAAAAAVGVATLAAAGVLADRTTGVLRPVSVDRANAARRCQSETLW